jgi:hypothetical protein
VNLGVGALSCGIGLAISVRVVGEDLLVELCLWDGDVQFWCCRTEQLHHQDKFGASRTMVEGPWNVEISPGPCALIYDYGGMYLGRVRSDIVIIVILDSCIYRPYSYNCPSFIESLVLIYPINCAYIFLFPSG